MEQDEERFIKVSIGTLARAIGLLTTSVRAINAVVLESPGPGVSRPPLLDDVEKELLGLEESLARIAEAFPPDDPGSGNGWPF